MNDFAFYAFRTTFFRKIFNKLVVEPKLSKFGTLFVIIRNYYSYKFRTLGYIYDKFQ